MPKASDPVTLFFVATGKPVVRVEFSESARERVGDEDLGPGSRIRPVSRYPPDDRGRVITAAE